MEQLVEELKIYRFDGDALDSRRNMLFIKNVINNTMVDNSGTLTIPVADSTTFYELKNINYVYLSSDTNFNLILNDTLVMTTRHFSFLNLDARISVAIQAQPEYRQRINFAYGNIIEGDEYDGMSACNSQYTAQWDKTLKNVIFTVQPGDLTESLENECGCKMYLNMTGD